MIHKFLGIADPFGGFNNTINVEKLMSNMKHSAMLIFQFHGSITQSNKFKNILFKIRLNYLPYFSDIR